MHQVIKKNRNKQVLVRWKPVKRWLPILNFQKEEKADEYYEFLFQFSSFRIK